MEVQRGRGGVEERVEERVDKARGKLAAGLGVMAGHRPQVEEEGEEEKE